MPKIIYLLCAILVIFQLSFSQRRIKDGTEVVSNKRYMVYFLKAASAPVHYNGWTCGGAIVSPSFVVTSAACIQDVKHLYVIAGYKHFQPDTKLEEDECLKNTKKKVILTCVPKLYQFDYNKTELWTRIDIAVVKVESPYDFTDPIYEKYCSYIPASITINYEVRYQQPGSDAMALGWGHAESYRGLLDEKSYNQDILRYAPTRLMEKDACLEYFEGNEMTEIISKYMICTLEEGNINDKGEVILKSIPNAQGCISQKDRLLGVKGKMCDEESGEIFSSKEEEGGTIVVLDETRRNRRDDDEAEVNRQANKADEINNKPTTKSAPNATESETKQDVEKINDTDSQIKVKLLEGEDTPGICQNDHGGPLVTWVGTHEVLIGVATMFKLDSKQQCRGPYLFTSTQCNSAFLNCILSMDNETHSLRSRNCDNPEENGFELVKRRISWVGHPDGPAANEIIHRRPQVPLSAFNLGRK